MAFLTRPDGTVLHYEDFNFAFPWEERGSPVVLVHGLGCNWTLWIKQLAWLVPYRRVIAIDNRGSGGSRPAAQGWSTRDMAADLRAVVEDAGLVKPVLVGLSMGGTIVLQYALDYPEALSHLVVADAPAGIPKEDQQQQEQQQEMHLINTVSAAETARRRMAHAFSTIGDQRLEQWLVAMIGAMDTDNYRFQANASFAFAFSVGDRLHEITVPTTVVWGALDAMFPVFVARIIQQAIPHATLRIVEGHGHFVNLEAPDVFNAILAEVLGLPSPASHPARDTIESAGSG
jgi:pimeloyl-ACP methyl ester carboxylesterase